MPTCIKNRLLRTDLGAWCVQLWIHSTEPLGEHRNENRRKQQQAECLVESAPLRGLDTGMSRDEFLHTHTLKISVVSFVRTI